jgi:hypothetical protein
MQAKGWLLPAMPIENVVDGSPTKTILPAWITPERVAMNARHAEDLQKMCWKKGRAA